MDSAYRTVWISDLHLGTAGCRAADLGDWLKSVRCEHLYLVGDIVDMWRLRQRWYWPAEHNRVVRRLLKMSQKGTRITYIPGNHDDAARQYLGLEFGGIRIAAHAMHETADGRHLLVTHGDQFDLVVRNAPLVAQLGGASYEMLLATNRLWNRMRSICGLPYHSLSAAIKMRVKQACTFVSRFESALREEASRGGFDGVVCGHIHRAHIEELAGGIAYYNCGDWVESRSALVEFADGRIEVLDAGAVLDAAVPAGPRGRAAVEDEELDIVTLPLPPMRRRSATVP
jgi:UDP-2,3-diacylglucosamine pyrophosphatase LpxH